MVFCTGNTYQVTSLLQGSYSFFPLSQVVVVGVVQNACSVMFRPGWEKVAVFLAVVHWLWPV